MKTLTRDAGLTSLVLRAAAAERAAITPDLGTAIVVLGAARLRGLIGSESRVARATSPLRRGKRGESSKLQALKKAIAGDQYRLDPVAIAHAMLRKLERS